MRLRALLLAALCSFAHAQTATFAPGPTLAAAAYPAPSASAPALTLSMTVNGQPSAATCVLRPATSASGPVLCPSCDLSSLSALGRLELRMVMSDGASTPGTSAPISVDHVRESCSPADMTGLVRCSTVFRPVGTPAPAITGACAKASSTSGTWRTPATGSFTLFRYSSGRLTGIIDGRKAPANVPCNCDAAKATTSSATYCAIAGSAANEVTACVSP